MTSIKLPRRRGSTATLARLKTEAGEIVRRLLETAATIDGIADEYGVGKGRIQSIYCSATTAAQRRAASTRKHRDHCPSAHLDQHAAAIVDRLLNSSVTVAAIAREFHVGADAVCRLYSQHTTHAQREEARVRKMRPALLRTAFRPGHKTWNLGMKGLRLSPATEFKKGCIRGSAARKWKAVGFITIRPNKTRRKYRFIKVRDDGPSQRRWQPYAHYVWEKATGKKVPPRHRVVHLDNDSLNDAIENLACLSYSDAIKWQRQAGGEKLEQRRKAGFAKAIARRREIGDAVNVHRAEVKRAAPARTVRLCAACGNEATGRSTKCPKCGGSSWERVDRPAEKTTTRTRLQQFLECLKEVA
jgi:hypothetical protein